MIWIWALGCLAALHLFTFYYFFLHVLFVFEEQRGLYKYVTIGHAREPTLLIYLQDADELMS
jgi:hypothetical protein